MKLPKNGRMINGVIFALESVAPYLSKNCDKELLPTPTSAQYGTNQGGYSGRTGKVRESLETMAKMGTLKLPTPTTMDSGPPLPPRKKNPSGGQKPPLNTVIGGRLNPTFVEYMMGLPKDYTKTLDEQELNNLEMALSHL